MYIPAHFAVTDAAVDELLARHGAADLITQTADGLLATMLPFVYEPAAGEHGTLYGHVARNNDQWRKPALGESLAIIRGPDAYISPSWYAAKAENGRVVPTWNYVTAHVYGRLIVHDDPSWVEDIVRRLTAKHETARLVGGRRAACLHRGPAARHRRPRAADHPHRGQGQAEPEPPGGRPGRHRGRPGRPRRHPQRRGRRGGQRRPRQRGRQALTRPGRPAGP